MNRKYNNNNNTLCALKKRINHKHCSLLPIVSPVFLMMVLTLNFGFFVNYQNTSLYVFAQTKETANNSSSSSDNQLALSNLIKQGSPYYGKESAPITIIDFSDLQCPMCKRHVDNTEPQINSTYVQTGKVAYVFKHLPNRGFDSMPAALAAQCTNDQGKFWAFHGILYKNQGPIDSGWANSENLKKFALQVPGMDINQFNSCFEGKKYQGLVKSDVSLANSLGFTETPSFIIANSDGSNPQKIEGPKPFPIFKTTIEKLGQ